MNTRTRSPGVGPTTTGADSEPATSSATASSYGTQSWPDLVIKQQTRSNPAEVVQAAGGTICERVFPSLTQWTENGAFRADVMTALQPRGGESTKVISFGTTFCLSGTQAAVHDCAAVLPSSVVLLAGTLPVGQWYTKVYPQKAAYATGPDEQVIQQAGVHDEHAADAILLALAEDDAFVSSWERQLLAEGKLSRSRASDTTPLLRVNRTDLRALQNNAHLSYALQCSIISFLNRYKQSRWMQWQKNYQTRIGITVAAECEFGKAMALCGVNNWLCQHPDYCPRCSVRLRAKPAAREYRTSFELAPYW
jgi:hypothetical protein